MRVKDPWSGVSDLVGRDRSNRPMLNTCNIGWGKGASVAGRERKLFTLRFDESVENPFAAVLCQKTKIKWGQSSRARAPLF